MIGDEEDFYHMSRAEFSGEYGDAVRAMKARLRGASGKNASRGQAGKVPVTSVAKVESDRSRKNSRTKGSRAELDVAEMFSRWCGEVVRRTPMSGGWSNAKFGVTADLVCPNPAFDLHVEIKHREGWVLDDLVTGDRREHDKSVVQWWKQCVTSCPKNEDGSCAKMPLLVFRRNFKPWLAMMPWIAAPAVGLDDALLRFTLPPGLLVRDVAVMRLDDFLDLRPVPPGLTNHKQQHRKGGR